MGFWWLSAVANQGDFHSVWKSPFSLALLILPPPLSAIKNIVAIV
jgi:hypothetical protein